MDRLNKERNEKKKAVRRILFDGFESEEELLVALERLEHYLQTLKDWDRKLKWKRHVPPETLN